MPPTSGYPLYIMKDKKGRIQLNICKLLLTFYSE